MSKININLNKNIVYSQNLLISELYNEEYLNKLLFNFDFKKPKSIFDVYIKEQFKDNEDLYNKNINNKKKDKLFSDKFKIFSESYSMLSMSEKNKYRILYEKENLNYLRNIEIIKKYIFKGVDGNIKIKKTAFHLFLSDELILGIEKGFSAKKIINDSFKKWENLDISIKQNYYLKKNLNDSFLDIVQNYKKIDSFILFIYYYLKTNNFEKDKILSMEKFANLYNDLSNKKKLLYEDYSNEFLFLRFKIRDIYDAIHGIYTKTPSGALRIFLQEKAYNEEIKSIQEGINLWNKLSEDKKEIYLSKCHLQFLAFKYKELLYNKKIKRFLPKKPRSPFAAFMQFNKGIYVPEGINTVKYMHFLYNNLSSEAKKKFEVKYSQLIENYNKKIIALNNKIFDLPKKPKSSFAFYLSEKLEYLNQNNKEFDINRAIDMIFLEWSNGKVDKSVYLEKAKKDKIRFEIQLKEFESLGYYYKNYEDDTIV